MKRPLLFHLGITLMLVTGVGIFATFVWSILQEINA